MDHVIYLDKIVKDYEGLRALVNVSFTMGPGITGLLGPNGAGKSTLIKLLLGLVKVTSGIGEVLGYELHSDTKEIRARVGYMPEDDCYIAGLTGIELMQMMARLAGQPRIEAMRRSHEILDFCGIEQERYRDVAGYSTGMRQKLKFAQAIVHDPPLLILDEPTAGLDPDERVMMLNRIRALATRADKAVLICTHILPDVQSICDSVVILTGGKVQVVESLEVLSWPAEPAYRLRVIGDAAAFVKRIELEGYEVEMTHFGEFTVRGLAEEQASRLWTWAQECGVGIQTLTPVRNSLEKIFVDAVREHAHANS
ncbi:MAG: ABC transporter-like protein [Planctomycetaceae bacterium]|nr:ABC transporter-like protein [Planctomycetaceae bacterium]